MATSGSGDSKKTVVWGIGYNGRHVVDHFLRSNIPIAFIVDTFSSLKNYGDIPIKSPQSLRNGADQYKVLVAMNDYGEAMETLEEWGYLPQRGYQIYDSFSVYAQFIDARVQEKLSEAMISRPPLFTFVEIETINRCNNDCSFCPANRHHDPRPLKIMDEALLDSILNQLQELEYDGTISLYSNNEPLLDVQIIARLNKARHKLPKANHVLFTNGILLNSHNLFPLIHPLDQLIIDDYTESGKDVSDNIRHISELIKTDPSAERKVEIKLRKKYAVLTSRGGQAPNKKTPDAGAATTCVLPFTQLVIRPDGKVSLCCSDALGLYTLGDLTRQSVKEVWYGDAWTKIRYILATKGRKALQCCDQCDLYHAASTEDFLRPGRTTMDFLRRNQTKPYGPA